MCSCAGMRLSRPSRMVFTIDASDDPYNHTSSVRLGAPTNGLPLPSTPWQATQKLPNSRLPRNTRIGSAVRPDSERTYCAMSPAALASMAAFQGGMTPWRPSLMVFMMTSGEPPCSQSPSVRLGKLGPPLASEPWHCAQLFRNRRWPISRAPASCEICGTVMVSKRA
ncbi:hypothetical protein D3C87_1601500 [compost metagenome]